ncbi:hypothetical protein [Gelidibacter salicanalis]|uniref:Uncharacterized protein n=1 Tax=Gelidibacter salicanalis TaxID=291193 RepID=A0A934KRZ0_9FLAO|nr:hypothetical protein [Gelidibacter salicanalis]MBJ7880331.1 hypothetical protein [Gelidibacter salicanalis]
MTKEGNKNRKNEIIIALIGALAAIIVPYINSKYSDDNSLSPIIYNNKDLETVTNIDTNEGAVTNSNVGVNHGTIYTGNPTIINANENNNTISYAIKGSIELFKYISDSKKIKINQSSKNVIELTYNGELSEIHEDSGIYVYNGGFLTLKYNGVLCHTFNEMYLPYISSNPKNTILDELQRRVDDLAIKNFQKIQNIILGCL